MSLSSTLSPITLADKDKLKGYENYASWKILMEAHGKPKGLHKYWGGKISIPGGYESAYESAASEDEDKDNPKPEKPTAPKPTPSVKVLGPTPLHSTTPSELEYELRESVAMSSILINISDIYGSGINPNQKSHIAWKHLANLYGRASDRARNMREEALANCKLEESGKVAGEDGHITSLF
ncbi:hypothetical protein HYPSUDRAFT_208613 [Hypholoma sublateritium FD-334 SS-4]|uniref:DUF4219 domain-containing protein n=1 Tax=Hypholoma sublateritium (strain FD-334 SS-4) TaxID=945553 RepID=A0A0D2LUM4_HYPSF|nr:hypothetical protein HYPSUDRAFT_208613 [Hypholoma sublateritium FD-334 SS-4]